MTRGRLCSVAVALLWGCAGEAPNSLLVSSSATGGGAVSTGTGGTGGITVSSTVGGGGSGGAGTGAGGVEPVLSEVHLLGRSDDADPRGPRFAWSGSTVLTRFEGTSVAIDLGGPGLHRFDVFVDGSPWAIVAHGGGDESHIVATDLAEGAHDLEIVQRTEALFGPWVLRGFTTAGGPAKLVPTPPPARRRLEFIGDSITAGYGVLGPNGECDFSAETESAVEAYAWRAARELGAEARIMAWSGKGVLQNYPGDDGPRMPTLWTRAIPTEANSAWDFARWIPEAVVVNLGSNDFSSAVDEAAFIDAYAGLLADVRAKYPDAPIFCVGGAFLSDQISTNVDAAVAKLGDPKVKRIELPGRDEAEGYGCDYHPSLSTQAKVGEALAALLRTELGW